MPPRTKYMDSKVDRLEEYEDIFDTYDDEFIQDFLEDIDQEEYEVYLDDESLEDYLLRKTCQDME